MNDKLAFALLIILNIIILWTLTRSQGGSPAAKTSGDKWTVYGTMGCGWTRKQIDYMKMKNKPYTFVDCSKGGCDGIDGYPTMVSSTGEKVVGFREV